MIAVLAERLEGRGTLHLAALCLGLGVMAALGGCSGDSASGGSLGATPGGAQDNDLAEKQIDQGGVPRPEAITVEGMLNAHDLPLAGVACEQDLCINAAYGVAPSLDTRRSAVFLQMGFDSGINAATFKRSPLNVAVVVDRSGSMAGTKIQAVRTALSRLIDQLNQADRLAIVMFDDRVELLLPSTPVADREALRALLPKIYDRGTTNMAAGLTAGFEQVTQNGGQAGIMDRVIVLTDALTNTGDIDTQTFVDLATTHAERGIGLTVLGVGTDLNQDLVLAISRLRGGNYLFLQDSQKISTVFDADFDYLMTPLAYQLKFTLAPAPGFRVARVYGYPAWQVGQSTVEIEVATVFLSKKHGALVARIEPIEGWPTGQPPLAELALSYATAGSGETVTQGVSSTYQGTSPLGDQAVFHSQPGVRRSVAFVNAALGEQAACSLYWNDRRADAITLLNDTQELLLGESIVLDDLELAEEARVVDELRSNMQASGTSPSPVYHPVATDEGDQYPSIACTVTSPRSQHRGWMLLGALAGMLLGARRRRSR
jgi:Ca-activated chloride channel family protein